MHTSAGVIDIYILDYILQQQGEKYLEFMVNSIHHWDQ